MNVEIEVKMRMTDRAVIEQRLGELNAQQQPGVFETNTYFDTPDGKLKSSDCGLRVRRIQANGGQSSARITYKGPRAHGQLKSRIENEVKIDDPRAAAQLLVVLGYLPSLSFEKKRVTWHLEGCLVELDTLPHLGEFIEIEGPSDEAVLAVRSKLELDDAPIIRASYISMLATYIREHHLDDHVIRFEAD